MLEAGATDPLVAADLLTLLQQQGRAAEAVAVLRRTNAATLPSYALLAATRAARDARRWSEAEALARQGLARFPREEVWPILLALILTDAGRVAEAEAVLATPRARAADAREQANAAAYLRQRQGSQAASRTASLLATTRAQRDARDYAAAEASAREGLRQSPSDPTWTLLLALILTDAGRPAEARALLQSPAARRAPALERLLALAYAEERAGERFTALRHYAEATRMAPRNTEARAGTARVLRSLGGPNGAAAIADAPPPLAEGRDRLPLGAEVAAADVRFGNTVRPVEPERRFEGTDRALARLDALLAEDPPPALRRQIRLDRVVALRDRVRMAEALAEADALAAEAPLPPYAREARADALLHLRRPREALVEYQAVVAADPGSLTARSGVFYAAVESEDFRTAYNAVDGALADQPGWRRFLDDPSRYPNPDFPNAALSAAQARFYGDQLAQAWERITPLAEGAPADQETRLANAAIMGARGWPWSAATETEIGHGLAPQTLGARIALAELALTQFRFAEAERRIAELLLIWPENLAVQRLALEARAQRRFVLEMEVKPGNSEGGGSNSSGRSLEAQVRLYSPPIAENWRIFALAGVATAHPIEGYVQRNRVGAGAEFRLPQFRATAYITQNFGTYIAPGGGVTADWQPFDTWRIGVAAERFALSTPLRALRYGITADEVAGRVTWRRSESTSVSGAIAYSPFTDGNRRLSGGIEARQRILDLPHLDVTLRGDLFASTNSLTTGPYFAPSRDFTATAGIAIEHVTWRFYENSFVQALTLDGGSYTQQGYGTGWVGTAAYEHRWRFDPMTEFRYGVQIGRRLYDGDPWRGYALVFALTQRL
nr:poly-beta-1,6 N-acetyl-D-glucosamine export porin PgaA [Roseococcus sp. SDR]